MLLEGNRKYEYSKLLYLEILINTANASLVFSNYGLDKYDILRKVTKRYEIIDKFLKFTNNTLF